MSLNARSIALQGIGFGALAVALHGFVDVRPVAAPELPRYSQSLAEIAFWKQIHEEDELLLSVLQHFVMEA